MRWLLAPLPAAAVLRVGADALFARYQREAPSPQREQFAAVWAVVLRAQAAAGAPRVCPQGDACAAAERW